MSDRELLPCPFCGSFLLEVVSNGHDSEFVECQDCGASGPADVDYSAASEAWNRRAAASIGQQMEK